MDLLCRDDRVLRLHFCKLIFERTGEGESGQQVDTGSLSASVKTLCVMDESRKEDGDIALLHVIQFGTDADLQRALLTEHYLGEVVDMRHEMAGSAAIDFKVIRDGFIQWLHRFLPPCH